MKVLQYMILSVSTGQDTGHGAKSNSRNISAAIPLTHY